MYPLSSPLSLRSLQNPHFLHQKSISLEIKSIQKKNRATRRIGTYHRITPTMKFATALYTRIFSVPISLLSLVILLPHPTHSTPGTTYWCTTPNFTPTASGAPRSCFLRSASEFAPPKARADGCREYLFAGPAKSIGPDPGTACVLYEDKECSAGREVGYVKFPGLAEGVPGFKGWSCKEVKE